MSDLDTTSTEETYCYGHPQTPTRLRCTRCDRPICGRCAIPASVGQHCPECVAEARKGVPKVKSALRATAPAIYTIIVINVIIYVLQQMQPAITDRYASFTPLIATGEYFRLMTAMFLHARTPLHVFMNMFFLYAYGQNVEHAFGTLRFVSMYLIAGFLGSAVSFAFGDCLGASVGASGAVFGIVGVLVSYLLKRRASQIVDVYLRNLGTVIVLNLIIGFVVPGIDWLAHVGGLAAGFALGWLTDAGVGSDAKGPAGRTALVYAGVIAAGIALVVWRTSTFGQSCFG